MAILFVGTALSGCVIEDLVGDSSEASAAKIITIEVPSDGEPDEFEDVVTVWFEYTHRGVTVDAAGFEVSYTHVSGEERTESFAAHTGRAQVAAGDVVRVNDVNITSGLVVRAGDEVLTERPAMPEDWFTVAGYPIPLAADGAGIARYEASASSGVEVSGSDLEIPDGPFVESFFASFTADMSGDMTMEVTMPQAGPRVESRAHLEGSVAAESDVHLIEDGQRMNNGGRATLDGRLDARSAMQFDTSGELSRVGFGGSVYLDGDVVVWDEDHPKEEEYRPEEIEHPIFDEEVEYSEEDFEGSDQPPEAEIVEFLTKLWAAGVGVGDELRFHQEESQGSLKITTDYVVQVVAREDRSTPAGSFDSWRVTQTQSVATTGGPGGTTDLEFGAVTYWIDTASGLMVAAQADATRQLDRDDMQALVDATGEDAGFEVPEDASVAVRGESLVQLVEYSPSLKTSRFLGVHAGASGVAAAAALVFVLVSDVGGSSYEDPYDPYDPYETTPAINFATDEAQDRLVVNSASSDADWYRIGVSASASAVDRVILMGSSPEPYQNKPASPTGADVSQGYAVDVTYTEAMILAGDYIEFCADGATLVNVQVELIDWFTGDTIGNFAFTSLAPC